MQSVKELVEGIKNGTLSPDAAVRRAATPARHIREVDIGNLKVDVLNCGFPSLDDLMVFKKKRSELIIFGARPSMGKSAFIFQTAAQIAEKENVLIYSLEMDYDSIVARMLASKSGRNLQHIQKGMVPRDTLRKAKDELDKLNFFVDDRSRLDVKTLRASANAFHEQVAPVSLVVVDYLQLVKSRERDNRNDEVGEVSAELKALAKDLNCPVLAAAQLNRECEKRGKAGGSYVPIMADLRDSGSIEQDADIIVFLSRQSVYDGTRPGEADISVAKNRNGGTTPGTPLVFDFLSTATRFIDRKEPTI